MPMTFAALEDYTVSTSNRLVRWLEASPDGRVFVHFDGDRLGLFELEYTEVDTLFSRSKLALIRLIAPDGQVANSASTRKTSVFFTMTSAVSETKLAVSRAVLPLSPAMRSQSLLRVHPQDRNVLITVDTDDVIRIYANAPDGTQPGRTRKRRRHADDMQTSSPTRRRLKSAFDYVFGGGETRQSMLVLSTMFDMSWLQEEFLVSSHSVARYLPPEGLGRIAESSVSTTDGITLLSLVTNTGRRLEIAIELNEQLYNRPEIAENKGAWLSLLGNPLRKAFGKGDAGVEEEPLVLFTLLGIQLLPSSVKTRGDTEFWKFGPISFTSRENVVPHNYILTMGIHPILAPMTMGRLPGDDGFISVETDESVSLIVDAAENVLDTLDFTLEKSKCALRTTDDLLRVAWRNLLLQTARKEELLSGRRISTSSLNHPSKLCVASFWVFFDTVRNSHSVNLHVELPHAKWFLLRFSFVLFMQHFRRLQIQWNNVEAGCGSNSFALNFLSNVNNCISRNPQDAESSNFRQALTASDAFLEDPDTIQTMSLKAGRVVGLVPSVGLETLQNVCDLYLTHNGVKMSRSLLDIPLKELILLDLDASQDLLSSILKVMGGEENKNFIIPAYLGKSRVFASTHLFASKNEKVSVKGLSYQKQSLLTQPRSELFFKQQSYRMCSLAAVMNLLGQILQLISILRELDASELSLKPEKLMCFSCMEILERMDPTSRSEILSSLPLRAYLSSPTHFSSLQEFANCTIKFLSTCFMDDDTPSKSRCSQGLSKQGASSQTPSKQESSRQGPSTSQKAKALSVISKECAWLLPESPFNVALEYRMEALHQIGDPNQKCEAIVNATLEMMVPKPTPNRQPTRNTRANTLARGDTLGRGDMEPVSARARGDATSRIEYSSDGGLPLLMARSLVTEKQRLLKKSLRLLFSTPGGGRAAAKLVVALCEQLPAQASMFSEILSEYTNELLREGTDDQVCVCVY